MCERSHQQSQCQQQDGTRDAHRNDRRERERQYRSLKTCHHSSERTAG